jgi:protein-S-isoprenylcysteine O-methyltransferase Ste14
MRDGPVGGLVLGVGPYRSVRHPGYSGMLVVHLAMPFFLGARWGLVPVLLEVVCFSIRTALEDRTLQDALKGYKEFTRQTRYRLPGVW